MECSQRNGLELHQIKWLAPFCLLIAVAFVLWSLVIWSWRERLDHDEMQHTHAAWLMYKGQKPYVDFFEHHPPYYWYFLKQFYRDHSANVEVFYWGRGWMLIAFALSIAFVVGIGAELLSIECGIAAAALFTCNRFMHFPAMIMRPDGWMLCLLLGGIYVFLRLWRRSFPWYDGVLPGCLLGLAFATHPRSGFTVLALAIMVACDVAFVRGWKVLWERKIGLMLFTVASLCPIVWPFLAFGFDTYYKNVYVWSLSILPAFEPWPIFGNFYVLGYALLPFTVFSIPICITSILRRQKDWLTDALLLMLVVCNIAGVCISTRPFIQVFYVLGPFAALFAARSIDWILQHLRPMHASVGLSFLILGGVLSNFHSPHWKDADRLKPQLEHIQRLNELVPEQERYAGAMAFHPIFRFDGTSYWSDNEMATFLAIDPSFRHDFVEEFKRTRPFLVQEGILQKLDFDPSQKEAMRQYLTEQYQRIPNTPLYLRRR